MGTNCRRKWSCLDEILQKDYSEPEEKLLSYLGQKYESVKRKAY